MLTAGTTGLWLAAVLSQAVPQPSGLSVCVDMAIRACGTGGVRSVTYTGGTPEYPTGQCSFECYPPPTTPTAPPRVKPGTAELLSVLVWTFPPRWEIDYVRPDGIVVTVCQPLGIPNDPLWCEVMLEMER